MVYTYRKKYEKNENLCWFGVPEQTFHRLSSKVSLTRHCYGDSLKFSFFHSSPHDDDDEGTNEKLFPSQLT